MLLLPLAQCVKCVVIPPPPLLIMARYKWSLFVVLEERCSGLETKSLSSIDSQSPIDGESQHITYYKFLS